MKRAIAALALVLFLASAPAYAYVPVGPYTGPPGWFEWVVAQGTQLWLALAGFETDDGGGDGPPTTKP